jgi:5'-nucleotidase
MLILVTNDDGINAPGLRALVEVASGFGDVEVVAPEAERSGISHAITLQEPLRAQRLANGWHVLSGTPADCVFIGINRLLPRRPDLVLSGINRGPNLGGDVLYSGTVGGAMEGTIQRIPAMAFSLVSNDGWPFDWAKGPVREVLRRGLEAGLPDDVTVNVNIPAPSLAPMRGYRVVRLGMRFYSNDIITRVDPRGGEYHWIGGTRVTMETDPGTDCGAVAAGYVSITPIQPDLMAHAALPRMAMFDTLGGMP